MYTSGKPSSVSSRVCAITRERGTGCWSTGASSTGWAHVVVVLSFDRTTGPVAAGAVGACPADGGGVAAGPTTVVTGCWAGGGCPTGDAAWATVADTPASATTTAVAPTYRRPAVIARRRPGAGSSSGELRVQ